MSLDEKLHLGGLIQLSFNYGPGRRSVLVLQGCMGDPYRPMTQLMSSTGGTKMSIKEIVEWIKTYNTPYKGTRHITFAGGDPLDQANSLTELAKTLKELPGEKFHLVCYTGREWEDFSKKLKGLIKYVDAFGCGPYDPARTCASNYSVLYSTNQRWVIPNGKNTKILSAEDANGGPTDLEKIHLLA